MNPLQTGPFFVFSDREEGRRGEEGVLSRINYTPYINAKWRPSWISPKLRKSAEMKHKIIETKKETLIGAKTQKVD